jgi:putative transcriptional regulator
MQKYVIKNDVERYRKEQKLTQEALAALVNVTRQTIISIEKGNYIPSVLLALRLAKVFNKHVEEVFQYESI